MAMSIAFFNQMSGVNAFNAYSTTIFQTINDNGGSINA